MPPRGMDATAVAHNTNRQGANFELDVMHYLAGCDCEINFARPRHVGWTGFGYDAGRSSGSRGKVDVWGVPPKDEYGKHPMVFVQCKITDPLLSPADRISLINLARRGGALPIVSFRAKDLASGRIRPHFRQLTGYGPKDWLAWEPRRSTS